MELDDRAANLNPLVPDDLINMGSISIQRNVNQLPITLVTSRPPDS